MSASYPAAVPSPIATEELRSAERIKLFTDAVVAIAMTLLILPLLEGVSTAADDGQGAATYIREEWGQLVSFALSFLIIARFWISHHRVYESIERYVTPLIWLNVGWMFTVVFLPVPTAMVGQMDTDRVQAALYIGTMAASSALLTATQWVVIRTPATWSDIEPNPDFLAGSFVLTALFLAAMAISVAVPGIGYASLLLLFLMRPIMRLRARRLPEVDVP